MSVNCGGWSETREATEHIQEIVDRIINHVEAKTDRAHCGSKAISYREQIVEGTNYIIKVRVVRETYSHLSIFENLRGGLDLRGVEQDKTKEDPLIPF